MIDNSIKISFIFIIIKIAWRHENWRPPTTTSPAPVVNYLPPTSVSCNWLSSQLDPLRELQVLSNTADQLGATGQAKRSFKRKRNRIHCTFLDRNECRSARCKSYLSNEIEEVSSSVASSVRKGSTKREEEISSDYTFEPRRASTPWLR